jgi:hypothetical protein
VGLRLRAIAYEHGEGVVRDQVLAASLYCHSARLGDVVAQYNLGWMSFFFQAAADQGLEVAGNMLRVVGGPTSEVPECMRPTPPWPSPHTRSNKIGNGPPPWQPHSARLKLLNQ